MTDSNERSFQHSFACCFQLFKFINFNQILAQMSKTLKRSTGDLVGFMLMFAACFMAFAHCGVLLFGHKMESFSQFHRSMCVSHHVQYMTRCSCAVYLLHIEP